MILRRASADDAEVIADIDIAARREAMPTVRWAHPPEAVRRWMREVLLSTHEVWLPEEDGAVLGYMALHDDWVAQLYVRPGFWRRGIGSLMLGHAKASRPRGLRLWCFQVNARARAFYETHEFTAVQYTDGRDNEEREPDILYSWQGSPSAGKIE
jgi:GNAT superfamily N-acetyltransferase